jgi:hypothetical protein
VNIIYPREPVGLAFAHAAQPAKVAPFAGGNEADVRKMARPATLPQPAKTTLFAGGSEADVRKMAAGHFSN